MVVRFNNIPTVFSGSYAPTNVKSVEPLYTSAPISPARDNYTKNPLYELYGTKEEIEAAVKSNPRIQEILAKIEELVSNAKLKNIKLGVNEKSLNDLKKGHLKDTRIMVAKIYSALPKKAREQVNLQALQEAAMFHDYGKVLIPTGVLDKNSSLTDEEKQIMNFHSELGYELLKNKNISKEALMLIKYHHQNHKGTGYPEIGADYDCNPLALEILYTADKFCALREDRCYRSSMGKNHAISVIYDDVMKGDVSRDVFFALKDCL